MLRMLQEHLREALQEAIREAMETDELRSGELPEITWEYPQEPAFGDFSTTVAFSLAKVLKRRPRDIAEAIIKHLSPDPAFVERVEVAGAGYLNFFLTKAFWRGVVREVLEQGEEYGRAQIGQGRRVQVEFVSANPTGPLHVGHGRGAALGDALANLLEAVGFQVEREYYINDAGTQMELLGCSVFARYREHFGLEVAFPEDGYKGEYIRDLAFSIAKQEGSRYLEGPESEAVRLLAWKASAEILAWIRQDLERFGVRFDRWFSERSLYETGEVDRALGLLKEKGYVYEEEGALWFRSTLFGDDKDRVLIRSTGEPTYYASDVAYHLEKFRRGYAVVIDIWGHDHHGYVPRVKAAVQALGYPPGALQIILVQLVSLLRKGRPVAMSTRAGEFVTLKEVVEEVGKDAARFIFLTRRADSPLDFDLEVAKAQSPENPVYYVQYAHARLTSVLREAEKAGLFPPYTDADLSRLDLPEELSLMKQLSFYPELIFGAASSYEPHRITAYLQDLAAQFHSYYNRHRIISPDRVLSRARLALAAGIRTVLKNALAILGVSAPERM
ncbi:MAG: arginine--tRNA ligase [Candidatus Methylomirabilales bacterium]